MLAGIGIKMIALSSHCQKKMATIAYSKRPLSNVVWNELTSKILYKLRDACYRMNAMENRKWDCFKKV